MHYTKQTPTTPGRNSLGTIIEDNGDGLDDSHMPVRWPQFIDGAIRQCYVHRKGTVQELQDMLKEYDTKRDSVFFSSGLADVALRLGPDRDISGERKLYMDSIGPYKHGKS